MPATRSSSRSSTPTRIIPPGNLPVIIVQFAQPNRSEHWTIIILASSSISHTFEIRGNRDSYTYVPGVINKPLFGLTTYRGGCHIGNVPEDKVNEVDQKFREIPIIKHETRWDPQVWVLDAVKVLKEEGWAFKGVNEAFIRMELQEDMVRWNGMVDTVDERLLSQLETGVPVAPAPVQSPEEQPEPSSSVNTAPNRGTTSTTQDT